MCLAEQPEQNATHLARFLIRVETPFWSGVLHSHSCCRSACKGASGTNNECNMRKGSQMFNLANKPVGLSKKCCEAVSTFVLWV